MVRSETLLNVKIKNSTIKISRVGDDEEDGTKKSKVAYSLGGVEVEIFFTKPMEIRMGTGVLSLA